MVIFGPGCVWGGWVGRRGQGAGREPLGEQAPILSAAGGPSYREGDARININFPGQPPNQAEKVLFLLSATQIQKGGPAPPRPPMTQPCLQGQGLPPHQKKQPSLRPAPYLTEPSRPLRGSMGMRGAVEDSPEPRDLGSDANFAPDSWDILGRPSSL